ncbi:uncharacterized protein MELLADRAFT_101929 [Melampsora larici-populina 98AG31]|uniref:Uncharacterized protein n=1 Tax=Melampsora larici-populina (strain 98AG31 / pathotype 3-4-7) TaxID=747676 RepID=F4R5E0_MELLP|nr:uncharacterized protein MELLADRAFT_101929 [Melampsora larici-populina 98AG31]EGG12277.1 hypothetical protein MELLADRAFT_101929 [Melampsora larici-populina 98AG31]
MAQSSVSCLRSVEYKSMVYIHAPEVKGSQLFVKRAKKDQSNFDVFCAATGGKPLKQKPTCKKKDASSKEPRLLCDKPAIPKSKTPTNATTRGELQCSEKAKLEIEFKDCDKNGKKPTKIFCELPSIPISCKTGPSATPLVNPPLISCITIGVKPTVTEPQCIPSKSGPTGKFTGALQCKKGETMTFVGTSVKNPCNAPVGNGKLFCTPPSKPVKN